MYSESRIDVEIIQRRWIKILICALEIITTHGARHIISLKKKETGTQ